MDVLEAKSIVLWSLFGITLLSGILPYIILVFNIFIINETVRKRYIRIICLLSCFAGGVFVATGLLHFFPEVDKALNKASWGHGFPLAGFSTAFGFFLVLTMEQIVLDYKEISINHFSAQASDDVDQVVDGVRDDSLTTSDDTVASSSVHVFDDSQSAFRAVLLTLALWVHSLYEGLAVSLMPDVNSVMQNFLAVGLHHSMIAFGLSLNLARSRLGLLSQFMCISVLSSASVSSLEVAKNNTYVFHLFDGVVHGLACGIFYYVIFFEILPYELNRGGDRLLKLLAILIGFTVICGVTFLYPDAAPNMASCS